MPEFTENSMQYELHGPLYMIYFATDVSLKLPVMKNLFTVLLSLVLISGSFCLPLAAQNKISYRSANEIIMHEEFNYPAGQLPTGWVLEGAQAPWSISASDLAGGEAPELFLGFSFAFGLSRLVSPPVEITGFQQLCLRYKQYIVNYEMDYGEVIGLDLTFDGGATWEPLWEKPLGLLNFPQDEFAYYFTVPEGATEFQFAFRFEGNNYAINFWTIDDIVVETAATNDLVAGNFSGSEMPLAGEDNFYMLEVVNGGTQVQDNYTVKLMTEDGVELASVPGEPVAFGERAYHFFFWAPDAAMTGSEVLYTEIIFADDENPSNNRSNGMPVSILPASTEFAQIGNGSQPITFLPYNFFNQHSLTQSLYLADEIGVEDASINGIFYTCQFDRDVEDVQLRIYIGETSVISLADNWVDPAALRPVFDGSFNFPKGFHSVYIPFSSAYSYSGGNIVVHSAKSYSEMVIGTPFICSIDTGSSRSRASERDDQPFNPLEIPEFGYSSDYYPNITFVYSTGTTGTGHTAAPVPVAVFPNPASDQVFLSSESEIRDVKVYNLMGQEVVHCMPGSGDAVIGVSDLDPGLYIFKVLTVKGMAVKKIQISH